MRPEQRAALFFLPDVKIDSIVPFGSGNVNDTYVLSLASGGRHLLQRLNPAVFRHPRQVIRNQRLVTDHLARLYLQRDSGQRGYQVPALLAGSEGDWYQAQDGSHWRLVSMIRDGRSIRTISNAEQAGELGRALGDFHLALSSLDRSLLHDPLPGFHYTPGYLQRYEDLAADAVQDDERDAFCRRFIREHRAMAFMLENRRGSLAEGIIHGDPKVDNFLFDRELRRVISLVDLDTVKPGMLLHDVGDALRSACNIAGENPEQPGETGCDPDLFAGWLQGYLDQASCLLTKTDRQYIVGAAALIAFELGLRFFTDFLEGNRYFKVKSPDHNLQRAMAQFYFVRSVLRQKQELQEIVNRLTPEGRNRKTA